MSIRKITSLALVFALVACAGFFTSVLTVNAAIITVTGGNDTFAAAVNCGSWEYSSVTATMPGNQSESYFRFTIDSNEQIYVRCSYDSDYEGMSAELFNANTNLVDMAESPMDVINPNSLIPFMPLDCNGTSNSQTFYVRVNRGDYDISLPMYFSLSFYNRIKTGTGTFSFSGTASNAGNSGMNSNGVDSSVLTLNLTNNTTIPPNAIVTSVTTKGTQSPSQGNVHHKILPATATSTWYTSTVSSASSGSYNISAANNFNAAQVWQFKYNVLATASSTMRNVSIKVNWRYDIADTNYAIF